MKRHTVKYAKARLRTKKGWDTQIVKRRDGVFFLTHQPVCGYGAVTTDTF